MTNLLSTIIEKFQQAIEKSFGSQYAEIDPLIKKVQAPHFGDYQANFAMALAKKLGKKPQEVAESVLDNLDTKANYAMANKQKLSKKLGKKPHEIYEAIFNYIDTEHVIEEAKISGPGFINFSLQNKFLQNKLSEIISDDRLGIEKIKSPMNIIVEYGSPNVAKEMHVGHLRSTIIGDAIARILDFIGHHVIRQNHIGDWGTQFGMLIQYLIENNIQLENEHSISDANILYKKAKVEFDRDEEFARKSREKVVALQAGDKNIHAIWKKLVIESEKHFQELYERLGVLLKFDDIRGESFYNPMLSEIVAELKQNNIAEISENAAVVFLPGFADKDNKPLPFLIQKSDGGYLYGTTDLAAAKFRIQELKAQRIIYVVDARQAQHFAMLFATVKKTNWQHDHVVFQHVAYGTVLGKDRKPFKTRSGETVTLASVLDEAESRAKEIVANRSELDEKQQNHIAHVVGTGALKYADLSSDKIKDYVFDWDRMLSFDGNTAPYLQNAYVRIQAIFRKGNVNITELNEHEIKLNEQVEHELAISLLEFPTLIETVARDLSLHILCNYLYELASLFHHFYEKCSVLNAENTDIKNSRLLLCELTARTLKCGLNLLGIEVLERM